MRAAPEFQVCLHRFGVWRGAVLVLAGLTVATTIAWLATRERPIETEVWVGSLLSMVAAVALTTSVVRTPPATLRWDGRAWHLGSTPGDLSPGELEIAIDLGRWMLLRFTPAASAGARVVWLPVQRKGMESQWHELRCSVHAPRIAADDDPTGGARG
jgi:hypothetical protein